MKPATTILLLYSAITVSAADFTLSQNGVGPIHIHTQFTYEGFGERLIMTATNDSGNTLSRVDLCLVAEGKGCLLTMWNEKPWEPGQRLDWNLTSFVHVRDLGHEVVITPSPAPSPAPTFTTPTAMAPVSEDREILTNAALIKLAKAGLGDDVMVALINSQPGRYTTTPTAVIALKEGGISDNVIVAVLARGAGSVSLGQYLPNAQPVQGPIESSARASNKPRVVLQAASLGTNLSAARNQSMEMSKDFQRDCPGLIVTINAQMADYTVLLNHIEAGLIIRDNQIQVANRDGDLLRTKEGGSIAGNMKSACELILADWAKR